MDTASKSIGCTIRELSAGFRRRPLNWDLIDALTTLEEREASLPHRAAVQESEASPSRQPDRGFWKR